MLISKIAGRCVLLASLFCVALAARAEAPPGATANAGSLVMIGGALRQDNEAVWRRIVELAGGAGAPIAVFASASINPKGSGGSVVNALNSAGAQAFFVPLAVKLVDVDYRQVAADPVWVAKVRGAKGVFFTGGDQGRITQALRQADGAPTPMLDAVWSVFNGGGVIAGTSAGTAIMSTTMFHDAIPVLATLKQGVGRDGIMAPGLGFLGPDVFADQHLLTRGRFARMLPAMLAHGYKLGVGVDENTAAVVSGGHQVEVIGYKGVLVVDLSDAKAAAASSVFDVRNARLSYLGRGDRYDLKSKSLVLSDEKAQRKLDASKPGNKTVRLYGDILGNTTVVDVMQNLIDNVQTEAIGLAFGGPAEPQPELGFEFRFRKGPDTVGYDTGKLGGEDHTVLNIYLDVVPVDMAVPLYRPRKVP